MRKSRILLVLAAVLLFESGAPAAVIYDFSGTSNPPIVITQTFRYTAPTFISSDTFVPASSLDACANDSAFPLPCFGVSFLPSGPDAPAGYLELTVQTLNPDSSVGTLFYYFDPGSSFASTGTLNTSTVYGNRGTLTISETVSAVPEPATISTSIIGLFAVVGAVSASRNHRRHDLKRT